MRRIACWLTVHRWIRVREVGAVARPGGILPSIDGLVAYAPDPNGEHRACSRCRTVDFLCQGDRSMSAPLTPQLEWRGGHRHAAADPCARSCPAYKEMLMEKTAARYNTTQTLNVRGEWVPAIPMPLFLNFGRVRCDCGHRSLGQRRYREHFALTHTLGLP